MPPRSRAERETDTDGTIAIASDITTTTGRLTSDVTGPLYKPYIAVAAEVSAPPHFRALTTIMLSKNAPSGSMNPSSAIGAAVRNIARLSPALSRNSSFGSFFLRERTK